MHHRFLHVQFSSVNQGLSEVDKCRYLMVLIANYISYTAAVTSYLIAHPLIASQTFLGLVTNITEQAPNFAPTPVDLEYSASASAEYFESAAFAAFSTNGYQQPSLVTHKHQPLRGCTASSTGTIPTPPRDTIAIKTITTNTAVTNGSTQGL